VRSSLVRLACLSQQITTLEQAVRKHLKHTPAYAQLLSVPGIGELLAQTMVLESGPMNRFASVGDDASYCRCVKSTKLRHGTRKGRGNTKNGNPYLEGASMEAAQFARRVDPKLQRFSQRKAAKSHLRVARKSVAHTLARACFDVLRDLVPFEVERAFGCG
jgi:transposase